MKYLITGGAGFIGSHLTDRLIEEGNEVTVLDNLSTGSVKNYDKHIHNSEFKFIEGSILDEELVFEETRKSDHVIHLAAAVGVMNIVNNPLDSLLTNIHGTENVLKAAYKFEKEVLIASTSEIYGKNGSESLNEDSDRIIGSPLVSRWSYSEAKAIDESLAYFYFKERNLKVRIVRFFNTVGPRQVGNYGMVIPRFVEAALSGKPIKVFGTGKQTRCFCHVYDVIDAISKLISNAESIGQVFNVGNNQEISMADLALKVKKKANSSSEIVHISYEDAYGDGFEDMQKRVPDISKIKKFVNWTPQLNIENVIQDVIDFQKRKS